MRLYHAFTLAILLVVFIAGFTSSALAQAYKLRLFSYGVKAKAAALNDYGQIAGAGIRTHEEGTFHPLLWTPSAPNGSTYSATRLGLLPGTVVGESTGINSQGQVVGYCETSSRIKLPFLWTPFVVNGIKGMLQALPVPAGTRHAWASQISNSGTIIGTVEAEDGSQRAALWSEGFYEEISPSPEYRSTVGVAIAPNYSAAIYAARAAGSYVTTHFILYPNGTSRALSSIWVHADYFGPSAASLHSDQLMAGLLREPTSRNGLDFPAIAAVLRNGEVATYGAYVPEERQTYATWVNRHGDAVGYVLGHGWNNSLLFKNNRRYGLENHLRYSEWSEACSINALGQVAGTGYFYSPTSPSGRYSSYLLTPFTPVIQRLAIPTDVVPGGRSYTGRVYLQCRSLIGGGTVKLSSSDPRIVVPETATIPDEGRSTAFAIQTAAVTTVVSGEITATFGDSSVTVPMTLRPIGMRSVSLKSPTTVGGTNTTATATLELPAAPADIIVQVETSHPHLVKPATDQLIIPAGARSRTIKLHTVAVTNPTAVTVRMTVNGISKEQQLTLTP
jgi:hypothetical protein